MHDAFKERERVRGVIRRAVAEQECGDRGGGRVVERCGVEFEPVEESEGEGEEGEAPEGGGEEEEVDG